MVKLGFAGRGAPLWRAFPGGGGETEESTTLGNNFSPPPFIPAAFFSSAYGEVGVFYTGVRDRRFIVFAR
jgi:hypothetical protein